MSGALPHELALHAPDRRHLDEIDPRGPAPLAGRAVRAPSRLVFGVELCEHLLPEPADAAIAARWALDRQWALSVVTPYVTDRFLPKVTAMVAAALDAYGAPIDVHVCDWGVLRQVRRTFSGRVRIVLSRLLNRAQHDPRVPEVGPEHLGGDAPPESWGRASHDSSSFRRFVRAQGVERIATELPLHGWAPPLPFAADDPPLVVHLPWTVVASGRLCLASALGKAPSVRFTPPSACDAPCRTTRIRMQAPWSFRDGPDVLVTLDSLTRRRNRLPEPAPGPRFWKRGNTDFVRLEGETLERAIDQVLTHPNVDRVIWEPTIPM